MVDDPDAHVAGGYLLARPWTPTAVDTTRLPSTVVTASSCLAAVGPDPSALSWVHASDEQRVADLEALGLAATDRDAVASWIEERHTAGGWGWPRVFTTLDIARSFVRDFPPAVPDLRVLLPALPDELVDAYLADHPAPSDPSIGPLAVDEAIRRRARPAAGGTVLGYEVLGEEAGGDFHSWHCNDLEPIVHERLGIVVNEHGLIDDLDAARRAAELVGGDDVGAEPVAWRPWLIIGYPTGAPSA